MRTAQIVTFIFLFASMMLFFNLNPLRYERRIKVEQILRGAKREMIVSPPPSRFQRAVQRFFHLLTLAKIPRELFLLMCLASCLSGMLAGRVFFPEYSIVLALGLSAIAVPFLFVLVHSRSAAQRESEELEGVMSNITHAYLGSGNIIAAFESYSNMRNKGLDPRLRKISPFEEFIIEIHSVDPSVESGLRRLQAKIGNRFFDDWINMLILCQGNRDLRFALQPIIKSFNDSKIMQVEAETALRLVWGEYVLLVSLCLGFTAALRFLYNIWFNIMIHTAIGRGLLCTLILSILLTSFYMLHVTRPLD